VSARGLDVRQGLGRGKGQGDDVQDDLWRQLKGVIKISGTYGPFEAQDWSGH
jgi:hypothetical protein